MGKPVDVELGNAGGLEVAGGGGGGGGWCAGPCGAIRRAVSFRCVFVLLLAAGLLVPALFLLAPSRREGYLSDDPDVLAAEIKVAFTLDKPVSFLTAYIDKLRNDIFEEIGVPNSMVSIVSMRPLTSKYSTQVVFGVLPYPNNVSISLPALSVLKSSLIEMMLRQLNLSLTPSLFGHPFSVELLRFPGGITVIPVQSGSIWASTDPLFNFVLNNSIYEILGNLTELKDQLKLGLNLRSYEKIFLQFRNENGSSVKAPATVGALVLDGSSNLLPDRLKQLALLITEHDGKNLGLNHSVFGNVKRVQLSSYLQHSISDVSPSPSPSPSPAPSPSPSLNVPPSLSPSGSIPYPPRPAFTNPSIPCQASPPLWSRCPCLPCLSCSHFPPTGGSTVTPPCIHRDPKLPPFMHSPEPSIVPSPTHLSPAFPPVPGHKNAPRHLPKTVPGPISQMMPIPSPSLPAFHPTPKRKKQNSRKSKFHTIAPSPYSLLHT